MRAIALAAVLVILAVSAGCGSSGRAVEVIGPATRNSGATVTSVSCPAPGECAAGGAYNSSDAAYQPLVVSQTNGIWGNAIRVPGIATLNRETSARVTAISCTAPGECAAGGYYFNGRGSGRSFVVSETNGQWGNAIDPGGDEVTSISCAAPGECAAAGGSFLVSETNGHWGKAIEVPVPAPLNVVYTAVHSISCAAAGECAAGGTYDTYSDRHGDVSHAFVVTETNGTWGTAMDVPGGRDAGVDSISCPAPGECAVGGSRTGSVWVASETNGTWGKAIEVRVPARIRDGDYTSLASISCAAPGNCAAGGSYNVFHGGVDHTKPFVVSETNGRWGNAIEVPGTATLATPCRPHLRRCFAPGAEVTSISCAAAGECAAGGAALHRFPFLSTYPINFPTFVVSETNGTWGNAIEVPGTATLNSVSCAAPGECAAGGGYYKAFVVSATDGHWGKALRFK